MPSSGITVILIALLSAAMAIVVTGRPPASSLQSTLLKLHGQHKRTKELTKNSYSSLQRLHLMQHMMASMRQLRDSNNNQVTSGELFGMDILHPLSTLKSRHSREQSDE